MNSEKTKAAIVATAPGSVAPYLRVDCQCEDEEFNRRMVEAIAIALAFIEKVPRTWFDLGVVICDEHVFRQEGAATMLLLPNAGTMAFCTSDMIVFPRKTLAPQPDWFLVAAALEELAHLVLNIGDEVLVSRIVCDLSKGYLKLNESGSYIQGDQQVK